MYLSDKAVDLIAEVEELFLPPFFKEHLKCLDKTGEHYSSRARSVVMMSDAARVVNQYPTVAEINDFFQEDTETQDRYVPELKYYYSGFLVAHVRVYARLYAEYLAQMEKKAKGTPLSRAYRAVVAADLEHTRD